MLRLAQWILKVAIVVIGGSWLWFVCAVRGYGWAENGGPVAALPDVFFAGLVVLPVLILLLFVTWAYEKRAKEP